MRILLLLLSNILILSVSSQTANPNVYPNAFLVESPTEGSNIVIDEDYRSLFGRLSIAMTPAMLNAFQIAETRFAIAVGDSILWTHDGPSFYRSRTSDFHNESLVSTLKDFSFLIPFDVVQDVFSNHPTAKLKVQYRVQLLGSGSFSGYFDGDYQYGILKTIKQPTFSGPDIVCNQNNYIIDNPGNITLENASGIATLTQLGLTNTYRIERIGTASGKVYLTSETRGQIARKEVIIGTPPPKITGAATVVAGNTYYYTIEKSDPNATISIDPVVSPGGAPYQISLSGNQITLTTGSLPSNANDYLIRIRATETGTCGSATGTLNVRFRGGEGPIH